MGHPAPLSRAQRRALARLSDLLARGDVYLAGGTAVALHLHHRRSADLDLFTARQDADLDALRISILNRLQDVEVVSQTDATLHLRLGDAAVDLVLYPYPPLEAPQPGPEGVAVAGLLDLATMKLAAIAKRGLRRDFWDLYVILHAGISLSDATEAYARRFGVAESDLYHVARALTFFDDAEAEPVMPRGLSPAKWKRIRAYFRREAPTLLR